jgi:hypothetical protein
VEAVTHRRQDVEFHLRDWKNFYLQLGTQY